MRLADLAHAGSQFLVVRTLADIDEAHRSGRIGLVFGLEAATPIENELDRLDVLYGLGDPPARDRLLRREHPRQWACPSRRRRPDRVRPPRGSPG